MLYNDRMDDYQKVLEAHYQPLLAEHQDHRAAGWWTESSQIRRFEVLLDVSPDILSSSILDVGCGTGHLVDILKRRKFSGDYLGVDPLPEMVERARDRHSDFSFEVCSVPFSDSLKADYVLASGIFTFTDEESMRQMIERMFNSCDKAAAINSQSTWADGREEGQLYADPLETLEFCKTLTPWVSLRHDYLPHDFTVYLYKDKQ